MFDVDTITIFYVNFPYQQLLSIPLVGTKDAVIITVSFQSSSTAYTNEYMARQKNTFDISVPKTFELANIILQLTKCSQHTGNQLPIEYATSVKGYFKTNQNHKLIQILNKKCKGEDLWNTYYGFRENSICFQFDEYDFLQYKTSYKSVNLDHSNIYGGHFRNLLYLLQDCATESNFQEFYSQNQDLYDRLVKRQKELLPIEEMWKWLENEFPQGKESYKNIFSPWLGGSHSTQNSAKGYNEFEFEECIMFINSPEQLDHTDHNEIINEGLMSGIVFTEIDDNYVNPTSAEHKTYIKDLLKDKDFWATKEAQKNYGSEYRIFNEYMTHSLFCLYVTEEYSAGDGKMIVDQRIRMMESRGYPKFEQFNTLLLKAMENNSKSIYVSYIEIIDKMHGVK